MTAVHWVRWLSQAGKTTAWAAALALAALVINSAVVYPSAAQQAALEQPEITLTDENSVDVLSLNLYLQLTDLSIGAKENPLTHTIYSLPRGDWIGGTSTGTAYPEGYIMDQYVPSNLSCGTGNCQITACSQNEVHIEVYLGASSETFRACIMRPDAPTGSTLSYSSGTSGSWQYTKKDGTTIIYCCGPSAGAAQQILYPDGRVLTYWRCADGPGVSKVCSVTRSDGLQLKYNYAVTPLGLWWVTSTTAINNAYEYCSPTKSAPCSLNMTWPTANYATVTSAGLVVFTVTDPAGRVTRYTEATGGPAGRLRTIGIKLPSSASADNITYTYCDNNCPQYAFEGSGVPYQDYVLRVVRDGQTWSYNGNPGSPTASQCGTATYGFTNPVGSGKQATLTNCLPNTTGGAFAGMLSPGQTPLIQLTDEQGVQYIAQNSRLTRSQIKPEGNQITYAWDERGNLTQETLVPKPNSPLAQVTLAANYDVACYPVKCDKPNWVKDGLTNQTDYTYDSTHGGVLTVTSPADSNGIRPQRRYTYTQRNALVLNASGAYVPSAAPIWVRATESYCRTSAAATSGTGCTLSGDEVVKTYEYGPNSGPNNLFLRGVAVTADGVTHRTCYGYDRFGNRISETQPAAALASCP
ncbi:MAG: hypothetical protein ACJ8R9_02765 [Steroidobacteraceae bacterium]